MAQGPQCPKLRSPHAPSTPRCETSRGLRYSQERKTLEGTSRYLIFSSDSLDAVRFSEPTNMNGEGCHNHDGHAEENKKTWPYSCCTLYSFGLSSCQSLGPFNDTAPRLRTLPFEVDTPRPARTHRRSNVLTAQSPETLNALKIYKPQQH